MPLPAAVALALVLPVAALAQCPTAADLAGGVRVTFDNGDTTTLQTVDGPIIEVTERYSWQAQSLIYQANYGLYALREVAVSPGGAQIPESVIEFVFADGPPVPDPAAPPFTGQREVHEYGMDAATEVWQVGFRAMPPVAIGECTYASVAVGIRLRPGAADQKDQFSYFLPDLGAGFIVSWVDSGTRQDTVPVRIEALP